MKTFYIFHLYYVKGPEYLFFNLPTCVYPNETIYDFNIYYRIMFCGILCCYVLREVVCTTRYWINCMYPKANIWDQQNMYLLQYHTLSCLRNKSLLGKCDDIYTFTVRSKQNEIKSSFSILYKLVFHDLLH